MLRRWSAIGAAALAACSGHQAASNGAGVGGGAAAASSASASSGGPADPAYYAAVVAETEVGQGPAFVALANGTDLYLTTFIGGASFVAVPTGQTSDPQLSWSANVAGEIKIGYCQPDGGSCVTFKPNIAGGPNAWTPGKSYLMSATGTKGSVKLVLDEKPAQPFVAVRAWDKPHLAGGNTVTIELAGAPAIAIDTVYNSPTDYVVVTKDAKPPQLARVRFKVGAIEKKADMSVALAGAAGFTVTIDSAPVPGAIAVQELK